MNRISSADFTDEYTHLREFGMTHEAVAKRLGMTDEALHKRLMRRGMRIFEDGEQRGIDFIRLMCEKGQAFSTVDLPYSCTDSDELVVLAFALRMKWIEKCELKPHPLSMDGGTVRVYRPLVSSFE